MEEDKKKIKRHSIWAVFLMALGMLAAFLLPEEALLAFFDLLKTIISHLLILPPYKNFKKAEDSSPTA